MSNPKFFDCTTPQTVPMFPETVIFDLARNQQVALIAGHLPLPLGTVIRLGDPIVDATVIGVRLWVGQDATLILDVEVPEEWWAARDAGVLPLSQGDA